MNDMILSEGNVQTEHGGGAQTFATPSGSSPAGNFDSELLTSGIQTAPQSVPNIGALMQQLGLQPAQISSGFEQFGSAIQGMQQQMVGQAQGGAGIQPAPLTTGFNHGWLQERLDAGSADGASITSSGGTPRSSPVGGGSKMPARDMSQMKGASRLMDGGGGGGFGSWFKGLFSRG